MKVDLAEIEKRIDSGLIRRQWTDDRKLMILNYTQRCSSERAWDEYTCLTRGLILREDGEIHARSFPKFWNLNEHPGPSLDSLPDENPVITTKMDGYLGLTYLHNGIVRVASRGSFTSEYAQWATDWLHRNNPTVIESNGETYTFVFEILHPKRIVVDNSGRHGLVLLAAVHIETGLEVDRTLLEAFGRIYRWPVVDVHPTTNMAEITNTAKVLKGVEQEGFVAHYPKSGVRVKVKGEDYCKIHRVVTNLTDLRIWEIMASGGGNLNHGTDILDGIMTIAPDIGISARVCNLKALFSRLWARAYMNATGIDRNASRKDVVAYLQNRVPDAWHESLAIYDEKFDNAAAMIWKKLRPVNHVMGGSNE